MTSPILIHLDVGVQPTPFQTSVKEFMDPTIDGRFILMLSFYVSPVDQDSQLISFSIYLPTQ